MSKFFDIGKYIRSFFGDKSGSKKKSGSDNKGSSSIKKVFNHFLEEGFSFWLDPYHVFRKSFVIRAGP